MFAYMLNNMSHTTYDAITVILNYHSTVRLVMIHINHYIQTNSKFSAKYFYNNLSICFP